MPVVHPPTPPCLRPTVLASRATPLRLEEAASCAPGDWTSPPGLKVSRIAQVAKRSCWSSTASFESPWVARKPSFAKETSSSFLSTANCASTAALPAQVHGSPLRRASKPSRPTARALPLPGLSELEQHRCRRASDGSCGRGPSSFAPRTSAYPTSVSAVPPGCGARSSRCWRASATTTTFAWSRAATNIPPNRCSRRWPARCA